MNSNFELKFSERYPEITRHILGKKYNTYNFDEEVERITFEELEEGVFKLALEAHRKKYTSEDKYKLLNARSKFYEIYEMKNKTSRCYINTLCNISINNLN
jgi:hypothetical protein